MKTYLIIATATILMILGCKSMDTNRIDNSTLVIKAGFICGWGSGQDSIEISQTAIKYIYHVPRESEKAKITKTRAVSSSEWTEIMNAVNMDNFNKLKYNTCNVCVDGCDEWINIQKDNQTHEIRFDKGATIDTIGKLQMKLAELRTEFNPK